MDGRTDPDGTARRVKREHALSFGPAARLYDAIRPSYPAAAVAWALAPLGPGRWRVADIGAGTGIMTRVLSSAGFDVVAVEPDPQMRRQLALASPDASVVPGSAESLPFPDASLDGAVAAQSYHWFDPVRAHGELARVIRPGGVFAAIWNNRDETVPWVAEYSRILAGGASQYATEHPDMQLSDDGFGPVESTEFRHATKQTPEGLIRLLQSRSYYLRASAERQQALTDEIRGLAHSHPDLAGREEFELPYITVVFRAVRGG